LTPIHPGPDDFRVDDDGIEIYTEPTQLETVRAALEQEHLAVAGAETAMVPKTMLELEPKDTVSVLRLMERLEELDDVQRVYSNLELSEEVLKQFV
jgi:transcriptional/translational regulatory protein YebC/TACO1